MERRTGAWLINLLFPRRCPVCHDVVSAKNSRICPECQGGLRFLKEPTCMKCGTELTDPGAEYCPVCRRRKRSFERSVSAFQYNDAARLSMVFFKSHGRREYADYYVEQLLYRRGHLIRSFCPQLILPVPIHRSRLRERGYNQAEELAVRIGKALNVPVRTDLLIRNKAGRDQKELNASARGRNLKGLFSVSRSLTGVKRVLLVDDVYTTGSTLQACTEILKAAGVEKVYACTIFIV